MKRDVIVGGVGVVLGVVLSVVLLLVLVSLRAASPSADALAGDMPPGTEAKRVPNFGRQEMQAAPAPSAAPVMPEGGSGAELSLGGIGAKGRGGGAGNGSGLGALARVAKDEAPGEAPTPPGRAWFPETFLFEPLVVTNESGVASVPVRIPDRLTQWRVLALGHSRSGAQAGAVSTFAGSLPTYVDPVLPAFLRAGDTVRLPVQVVNTTDAPVTRALKVEAEGVASLEGGSRTVTVPAAGSVVEYVTLRAERPGRVTMRAWLGGTDSVERSVDVWPTGRLVAETRGGTLATQRSLELAVPEDAVAGSERVRLVVFPGALGVLRSELAAAPGRGGVADDAYALMLAGRAPQLLASLGGTVEKKDLERMSILAGQRVLRAAGSVPQLTTATLLAEAALAHPDSIVLTRLGERLSAQVAQAQRPDGSCQGEDGWTVQRLLVATSDCTRVVRAGMGTEAGQRRASAFGARAAGAFERNLQLLQEDDGYTAAAVLASGGVSGSVRDRLRALLLKVLQKRSDGTVFLPVVEGVVRADGRVPSEAEATALAVLALADEPKAPLADLGTSLLADYRPESGWGDGYANRIGLQAVLALFKEPLPTGVRVVLERDGKRMSEGVLDAQALREVRTLELAVPGSVGTHTWSVRAEPAVPGLGFSLTLASHVPWRASGAASGLELAVTAPQKAKLGASTEIVLQGASPAGLPLSLRQELPAGVQVDRASLEVLVLEGRVLSYEVEDGAVRFNLPARGAAEPFAARFRVVPTLAGSLQAGASTLTALDGTNRTSHVPPTTWAVQ